jgi:hypothetical protein
MILIWKRIAVLEQIVKNQQKLSDKLDARMERSEDRRHADLFLLLTLGPGATALLLGAMAHGFHWL